MWILGYKAKPMQGGTSMNNPIDLEQLTTIETKLSNIKQLYQDVLTLHTKFQELKPTRVLFSVKPIDETAKPNPPVVTPPSSVENLKRLHPEEINYLRDNFGKALSPEQIAKHLGITRPEVYQFAKELNLQETFPPDVRQYKPGSKSGKLSPEDKKFLSEKYESGEMSPADLARHFGVATPTITYHIKKLGLSVINPKEV
jgi:plasmid maintenance system antidote protein VapI